MMKKLLTLVLVLCIASSASAVVVTLDPSGSAKVPAGAYDMDVVSADDDLPYDFFLHVPVMTFGDLTAVMILPDAGGDAETQDFADAIGAGTHTIRINALDMNANEGPEDIFAGVHFTATVDFTGDATGEDLTVQLWDAGFNVIDSYTLEGIPEPATMLLLGLGGLLLRRRK